jgi:hypothetical protein
MVIYLKRNGKIAMVIFIQDRTKSANMANKKWQLSISLMLMHVYAYVKVCSLYLGVIYEY